MIHEAEAQKYWQQLTEQREKQAKADERRRRKDERLREKAAELEKREAELLRFIFRFRAELDADWRALGMEPPDRNRAEKEEAAMKEEQMKEDSKWMVYFQNFERSGQESQK